MIFISILILLVAKALPFISSHISNIYFTRISTMVFIYAGVLSFNTFYIQSIGSGIGIYSGLFHITNISVLIEFFLLLIGSIILIAWPLYNKTTTSDLSNLSLKKKNNRELNLPLNGEKNRKGKIGNESSSAWTPIIKIIQEREKVLANKVEDNLEIEHPVKGVDNLNYSTDYSLIVLFSTLGSCLLISSSDLISMYLSIELQSFGLYVLSTLYRDSESSTKAGLKYFLLGGLSSCLILLGAGLIYAYTGLTHFESIYSLISVIGSPLHMGPLNILQGLYLGVILIIIGFLFKIAAAPLHNWSPDVYDETPTIVTIWLTIMPKISILIFLLEFITNLLSYSTVGSLSISQDTLLILPTVSSIIVDNNLLILKNLLLVSSLLSLIIGTVVGLAQTRIKRLLAYSTISHLGFILLALLINTEQSIDSLLFYIIQYSITNLNIFLILIALSYIINPSNSLNNTQKDINYISELKEQFTLNPLLSFSLSICLFSMAGIPPLIGFFSKQFVLYSAIQSGYYFISIIAIIVSVISASYYLKIIKVMTSSKDSSFVQSGEQNNENPFTNASPNPISRTPHSPAFPVRGGGAGEMVASLGTESLIIEQESSTRKQSEIPLTNFHSFLISTLTLTILLFIFKPSLILNSTQLLSLSLFNF